MNSLIISIYILLWSWLHSFSFSHQNCDRIAISEAMDKADLIAIGTITSIDEYPEGIIFYLKIEEQFKQRGRFLNGSIYQSKSSSHSISFRIGERYLVYGIEAKENQYWIKTSCNMRTMPIAEASYDLRYLRKNTICENSAPEAKGCPYNLSPVCGCNGITYSNTCFAYYAGVTWWRPGKCD